MAGVRFEREGAIGTLVVDRPETRNSLNSEAMDAIDAALAEAAGSALHALFIRGAGDRAFISGGDLNELESNRTETFALAMAQRMRATLDRIPSLEMPVVALLNGHAIGGGAEVAVACDFRVAVGGARIGFTQARLGLLPAWGGIERLAELVGRGRALALLTTGRTLVAEEAQQWGLIEEVVSRDRFEARVAELSTELAAVPRPVLAAIKRVLAASQPYARPDLAGSATADFARAWAAPAHWAAAERMEAERRQR